MAFGGSLKLKFSFDRWFIFISFMLVSGVIYLVENLGRRQMCVK
jgi:hypothetical protein